MKARLFAAVLAGLMPVVGIAPSHAAVPDKKVLMALWRGDTESEIAFKARLAELGVKVSYTEIDGLQDRSKLASVMRPLEDDIAAKKFDLIYSYGSVGTQVAMAIADGAAPIVFNIVYNPVGSKFVNSLDVPGGNVTGVTNGVPIVDQFNAFMALHPMKSLVVLFNSREPNSDTIELQVKEWASKNNVAFTSRRVAPEGDSLATVYDEFKSGKLDADALYAGADSFLGSKADEINAVLGNKVALYGGTQTFVLHGWLAAYAPAVTDMGITAADQAAKILAGQNPATLPVILPPSKLYLSQNAAAKHGLTPPPAAALEK